MGLLDHFRGGELECGPNMKVKNFKKAFKEELGVEVKVYIKNSNSIAKDDVTLGSTKADDFRGKGEEVKFYGRCDGYWIGNVIFRDATIK